MLDDEGLIGEDVLLARADLFSEEELFGTAERRYLRESGVRCGRPVIFPLAETDLPAWLPGQAELTGQRLYRAFFTFDLEPVPDGQFYSMAEFTVHLDDTAISVVSVDPIGETPGLLSAQPAVLALTRARPGLLNRLRRPGSPPTASVSGLHSESFTCTYEIAPGDELIPRSYSVHTGLEIPPGIEEITGTLRVSALICQSAFGFTRRRQARTMREIPFSERLTGTTGSGAAVRLCLATDIERYSPLGNEEQKRRQSLLVELLADAVTAAGLGLRDVPAQEQGDGRLLVFPPGIDESKVIPALTNALRTGLYLINQGNGGRLRMRLRVALHRGLVERWTNGYVGVAAIAVHRILDSEPLRRSLREHEAADMALIMPDSLFQDVIAQRYGGGLPPEAFRREIASRSDKHFEEVCWVHVPGR